MAPRFPQTLTQDNRRRANRPASLVVTISSVVIHSLLGFYSERGSEKQDIDTHVLEISILLREVVVGDFFFITTLTRMRPVCSQIERRCLDLGTHSNDGKSLIP